MVSSNYHFKESSHSNGYKRNLVINYNMEYKNLIMVNYCTFVVLSHAYI